VMYAMADYIGEENVNHALHALIEKYAFKGPPYPNATALIDALREVTPPQYKYVIDDWFESITLYDNRATRATARPLPDGRFEVTITAVANKRKADDLGHETDAPLDDWIDVGVTDADGGLLYREKTHVTKADNTFTVVVAAKPARAGLDPLTLLIDRTPKDNLVAVELAPPEGQRVP